ncbi:MAG: hypothetical protein OEZ36_07635 [Spirochaetota bacterium]|nr:hypothetical protein [Spirochaetota bacterium]
MEKKKLELEDKLDEMVYQDAVKKNERAKYDQIKNFFENKLKTPLAGHRNAINEAVQRDINQR